MSLDLTNETGRTNYHITLTAVSVFPEGFDAPLITWVRKKCSMALLVSEGGPDTDKHLHYHCLGSWTTTNTSNVTQACKTFYKKNKMEWSKNAVKVTKVPELYGLFHYLLKDVCPNTEPLLVIGWRLSWIKEKIKENLMKMPHCMLLKKRYMLTPKTATPMLCKYADAVGVQVTCKESFKSLCVRMVKDGYDFSNVKWRILYAQVMVHFGDDHALESLIDGELQFI